MPYLISFINLLSFSVPPPPSDTTFLCCSSHTEYLELVDDRLRQEKDRVEQCLDMDTLDRVVKIVEQEMIEGHIDTILQLPNGIDFIVDNQRTGGMAQER